MSQNMILRQGGKLNQYFFLQLCACQSFGEKAEDNIFSSVLLLGDINCDFLRKTGHVNMVDSFITEKSFIKSWSKFPVDFTRSQQNENQFISSTLDHFFWNEDLDEQIIDAGVLHSSDNDSDHSPIYCVLKSQPVLAEHQNDNLAQDKPSWRKASPEERNDFQNLLNENLTAIEIPASLNNCNCQANNALHPTGRKSLQAGQMRSSPSEIEHSSGAKFGSRPENQLELSFII